MKKLKELINKAPCKYCHQTEDGGIDIVELGINLGVLGNIKTGINMLADPFCKNETGGKIALFAWGVDEYIDGYEIINIRFCPFCGRNLKEEREGNEM